MTGFQDDELRAMLESRAERASLDPVSILADARGRILEPPTSGSRSFRLRGVAAALGGLAVATAVILLVVSLPPTVRPAASSAPGVTEPTAGTSSSPQPAASLAPPRLTPPTADTAVTAADLNPAMGDTTSFVGLTIAFQGALIADPDPCPPGNTCGLRLEGLSRPHTLLAAEGQVLPTLPSSGRIEGIFAIHFTDRILDDGRMVFEDVGPLTPAPVGLPWPIATLAARDAGLPPGFIAVTGWVIRRANPCNEMLGCVFVICKAADGGPCNSHDEYLTAERYPLVQSDGSHLAPPRATSLVLPPGSYDDWAPSDDVRAQGINPRPVTLILRRDAEGRGSWQVIGRLDRPPWTEPMAPPEPTPVPAPATPPPPATSDHQPGGFPVALEGQPVFVGLDAEARLQAATDDAPFLAGGWYDSHVLTTCSPPVGQAGLNPLEARTCGGRVAGIPGEPLYRDGFQLPDGGGPIVLRLHTRDPGAAACTPEGRVRCLERSVADAVVWFGDAGSAVAPITAVEGRNLATSVSVMEWRGVSANSQAGVDEDVFTAPIACPAPWPTQLFSIHGDPRYGLVALFPDAAARAFFQASTDPEVGRKCLDLLIERPAPARWVGHENMLELLFSDDTFATRLAAVLENPASYQKALPMTDPSFDRTMGTVTDYLVARSSGELDHAYGERLPAEDANAYPRWYADVLRRHAADALRGRVDVLDENPTEARVGSRLWRLLGDAATKARIVRVTYEHATDPRLATEEFLVIHDPKSEFHDWTLVRIAGEPYPP